MLLHFFKLPKFWIIVFEKQDESTIFYSLWFQQETYTEELVTKSKSNINNNDDQ